jgi:GNAT superfamily N-acetyltransferase
VRHSVFIIPLYTCFTDFYGEKGVEMDASNQNRMVAPNAFAVQVRPGRYVTNVYLFLQHAAFGVNVNIGKALAQLVHRSAAANDREYEQRIREHPEELAGRTHEVRQALWAARSRDVRIPGDFAVLHELEIHKEYRGNGFAALFLPLVLHTLHTRWSVAQVVVQPFPYESGGADPETLRSAVKRLQQFYARFGFAVIRERVLLSDKGVRVHYMYCNLAP